MRPQFWLPLVYVPPDQIAARARQAEEDGWDGVKLADTQCLHGDPFVMMTAGIGGDVRALSHGGAQLPAPHASDVRIDPGVASHR